METSGPALRRLAVNTVRSGLLFAPAGFVFQISQSWLSSYDTLPKGIFIWLVPITSAVLYMLVVGLIFSLTSARRAVPPIDSAPRFRGAVIQYAKSLVEKNRDTALLELREGVNVLFHTQSANSDRIELGELALEAALRQHHVEKQISILIDDLGWANHMVGNDSLALRNVDRALEIVRNLEPGQLSREIRLLNAKALRHKAIMVAGADLGSAKEFIRAARDDIAAAQLEGRRGDIETAQLLHAEALATGINLDLLDGRRIRPDNADECMEATEALATVHEARILFFRHMSSTRYAKALYLEHCLLVALGREMEAHEVKTVLNDALGKSSWDIEAVQVNIRGGRSNA